MLFPLWAALFALISIPALAQASGTLPGFQLQSLVEDSDPAAPEPFVTTYRPSPVAADRVKRQFSAAIDRASADKGSRLGRIFAQPDPRAAWAEFVRPHGLDQGDVVDAYAAYWLASWIVSNRQDFVQPAPAQVQALRKQSQHAVWANPFIRRLSEEQRQEVAETLMYAYLLQRTAYEDALERRNPATVARLSDGASARFSSEGSVDLRSLHLTPRGLRGNLSPPASPPLEPTATRTPAQAAPGPEPAVNSYIVPLSGLYLHLEYRAGMGGAIYPTYEPFAFLPDGTVTSDLSYYPQSDADIAAWRARKPRSWGRWNRDGSTIAIRWDDPRKKPETWSKWFDSKTAAPGQTPLGRYQSLMGGGNTALGGDAMVAAWSTFDFQPDGTVIIGGGAGSSTADVTTTARRAGQRARYRLEGYAITLLFPDGRTRREWFYRYPDSDRVIGIGSSTFTLKR